MPCDIRTVNAAYLETDCECGETFQWHRECRNQCPHCGRDFGFLMTLQEINDKFRRFRDNA